MYDELTEIDIKKMQDEIDYRRGTLAPKLGAELRRTREFGDLSENAEYKEAKREKLRNDARIRYLENMIRTANVIEIEKSDGRVALFDNVTVLNEKNGMEKTVQIVTTLRQNALAGYVSKESPLGRAIMGKAVGDRALVQVSDTVSYFVVIKKIESGNDNEDIPISSY